MASVMNRSRHVAAQRLRSRVAGRISSGTNLPVASSPRSLARNRRIIEISLSRTYQLQRSCHAIPEGQNGRPSLVNKPLNEKNIPNRDIVNPAVWKCLASQRAEKSVNADVFGQKRSTDRRRVRPCPVSSWSDSDCRSKALYEPSNRLITTFSPALFLLMAVNYQCMPLSIAKGIAITVTTKPQKIALSDSKSTRANAACETLV